MFNIICTASHMNTDLKALRVVILDDRLTKDLRYAVLIMIV